MASFELRSITKLGENLIAKGIAGAEINFSRLAIGSGYLPSGHVAYEQTDLVQWVLDVDIIKKKVLGGGKLVIGGIFDNGAITKEFYYREIGVFAIDPDIGEILYSYGNAGAAAELIKPAGPGGFDTKSIDPITTVRACENFTVTIDPRGYISVEMFDEFITRHEADVSALETGIQELADETNRQLAEKAGLDVATQSKKGLMAAADKKKLDGVAAGANNYVHPANHAASMITESGVRQFVSDAEKDVWNGKAAGNHTHTAAQVGALAANARAVDSAKLAGQLPEWYMPTGAILSFGGASAPAGWLLCDGAAVSRTIYSKLFAVIGTVYGSGDGSTTFNLPDFRERVPVGPGPNLSRGTKNSLDTKTHKLIDIENGPHIHPLSSNSAAQAFGTWALAGSSKVGQEVISNQPVKSSGDGAAHNNMQPYLAMPYIIKT